MFVSFWKQYVEQLLLCRDNGIFHAFANAEFKRRFRRDFDCFAGRRVATLARFALGENHFAEAGKREFAVGRDLASGKSRKFIEEFFDLRTLQLEFIGEVVDDFGLRHFLLGCFCCRHFVVLLTSIFGERERIVKACYKQI